MLKVKRICIGGIYHLPKEISKDCRISSKNPKDSIWMLRLLEVWRILLIFALYVLLPEHFSYICYLHFQDPQEPAFNTLVRIMATRCMLSAEYFCSGSVSRDTFGHYGLASPIYTHFTSPIRRYAGTFWATGLTSTEEESFRRISPSSTCRSNQLHNSASIASWESQCRANSRKRQP